MLRCIGRLLADLFSNSGTGIKLSAIAPADDINETDKEVVITAELPGVSDKDVEVSLAGEMLTIKGEKRAEREAKNGDSTYMVRFGSFSRSVRLTFEVKDEKVDILFDGGPRRLRVSWSDCDRHADLTLDPAHRSLQLSGLGRWIVSTPSLNLAWTHTNAEV